MEKEERLNFIAPYKKISIFIEALYEEARKWL